MLHTEPIRTQVEGEDGERQEKTAAEVHRLMGLTENRPHNWMATEQSSVMQHENSSFNFVSQTIDFKGRQMTRGDNDGSEEKEKQGDDPAPGGPPALTAEPEQVPQQEGQPAEPAEPQKSEGVEQAQKHIDLLPDSRALNIK